MHGAVVVQLESFAEIIAVGDCACAAGQAARAAIATIKVPKNTFIGFLQSVGLAVVVVLR